MLTSSGLFSRKLRHILHYLLGRRISSLFLPFYLHNTNAFSLSCSSIVLGCHSPKLFGIAFLLLPLDLDEVCHLRYSDA